jgi:ankyrin repeat protein
MKWKQTSIAVSQYIQGTKSYLQETIPAFFIGLLINPYKKANGQTAMLWAVENNDENSLSQLCSISDINALRYPKGNSILIHVVKNQTFTASQIKLLLENNASVTMQSSSNGNNPIHQAMIRGELPVINQLLNAANITTALNTKNKAGQTPLHLAITNKDIAKQDELIMTLVKKNASCLIEDGTCQTALDYFLINNKSDLIQEILQYSIAQKIDITRTDQNNPSAISLLFEDYNPSSNKKQIDDPKLMAITIIITTSLKDNSTQQMILENLKNHDEIIGNYLSYMIINHATTKQKDKLTRNIFDLINWALQNTSPKAIEQIINNAAIDEILKQSLNTSITKQDQYNQNYLHQAMMQNNKKVFEALHNFCNKTQIPQIHSQYFLEQPTTIDQTQQNQTDSAGFIPLHYIAAAGFTTGVNTILTANDELVNQQSNSGLTPAHLAAQCGHQDVIVELRIKGANFTIQDYNMLTPLHAAICKNNKDIAKTMFEKMSEANQKALIKIAANQSFMALNHHNKEGLGITRALLKNLYSNIIIDIQKDKPNLKLKVRFDDRIKDKVEQNASSYIKLKTMLDRTSTDHCDLHLNDTIVLQEIEKLGASILNEDETVV